MGWFNIRHGKVQHFFNARGFPICGRLKDKAGRVLHRTIGVRRCKDCEVICARPPGKQVYTLTEDVTRSVRGSKDLVVVWIAGTRVVFIKTVNVGGQDVAMVYPEGGDSTRPFAVLQQKLTALSR